MRCLVTCCMWSACLAVLVTDPVPLTEYYSRTLKEYKGLTWDTITPANAAKMLRVNSISNPEFNELVRQAYPFIVEDCATENQLVNMPCSEYARRWPNEHMKAEYTEGQAHIYLRDPTWYTEGKATVQAPQHLSRGKPIAGPYVWHVKDEMEDPETKRTLQKMFSVPYFLNSSALNRNEVLDSFEFWFALENGGTQAHADSYCETTISMQLRGRKRWRLGAFPNISNAFQPYTFLDGEIYDTPEFWKPEYEEVVDPGSCVVFPMGYIHETYIESGDGGDDGCSVASTFQIQDPQPVFQWKNFLTRWGLSHYARDEPCMEQMAQYVYLNKQREIEKGKTEEAMLATSKKAFEAMDKDSDGQLTIAELRAQYAATTDFQPPWSEVHSKKVFAAVKKEKLEWQSEDALLYHDDDKDGKVSLQEFQDSVLKYASVTQRVKSIKKAKSRSAMFNKEQKWIREHLCKSDTCSYLDQLQADYTESASQRRAEL